jgi:hypothetical protein
LQRRTAGSTVDPTKVRLVEMGASPNLRWVTIVVAASLAAAVPAGAQEPASPDAAPSGSSAPSPDPAPVKTKPRVVRAAPRPVATVTTTTVRPTAPAATTTPKPATSTPARRVTRHEARSHQRKTARDRKAAAHAPARRARVALPRMPHLTLAQLSAPTSTADDGRARKLAVGALSLLILALASATLLAFTARVERGRVVR